MTKTRPFAVAVVLASLAGCAVSPEYAVREVQATAADRLGRPELQWLRGKDAEKAVSEKVQRLLESPLTVESAVQISLLNNRRLQGKYEELGIAQADLVQAGLLENPGLDAEILVNGGVNTEFAIVQNFFNILTLAAQRTIAGSTFEGAKAELGHGLLEHAAEVRSAYYKLVGDEQAAELFRTVVAATEAAADLSERQVEAGNASRRDQALQQAQYAKATAQLARIEAQISSDREALNRLLGLWGEQIAWNLPERLSDVPSERISVDGLEALAIERRLDLAGARAELLAAGYALDLGRQLRLLNILGLGVKFEREPDGKWAKGPVITFSLPIFDQGQARIASLEGQRRRSEHALVALATDVRSQVRDSWARMVAAQDAAAFYQQQILPLRQQIVEEELRLYNGMLISVYDLLRGRQEQIDAAREYIDVLKDYWIARSDLEQAIAGPLPAAGTAQQAQRRE
jgi:outer membrane protein, heavy metal efflux system